MLHPFEIFLQEFVPVLEKKAIQVNKISWILETTSSPDAADLKAELEEELKLLLSDPALYKKLEEWKRDPTLKDPLLSRQCDVLFRLCKQNQIDREIIRKIAEKEAKLSCTYAQFRSELDGKKVSENEIREVLKKERDVAKRKRAWESSKEIGKVLSPQILELVLLRNQAAKSLGYDNFFVMQLDLQEVDDQWLMATLGELAERSSEAYSKVLHEIEGALTKLFSVPVSELGPWSWAEPFCQEDPLGQQDLDLLVQGVDILTSCTAFYDEMGFDVRGVLARSDNEERAGKNQHAFCMNVDRRGDVRTLNNVKPSIKWLETVLHELGHAIYDLGYEEKLPWLLREPPHMITTEAMALVAGRQAYAPYSLEKLVGKEKKELAFAAEKSVKRRQLIFSRWVLVMTHFERELYANPMQDLQVLWWQCVKKYQGINPPPGREGKWDWATKYHMGLAPVYYFSYLLGEVFASGLIEAARKEGSTQFCSKATGAFLRTKLFAPGNRMDWLSLVKHATGSPFSIEPWLFSTL